MKSQENNAPNCQNCKRAGTAETQQMTVIGRLIDGIEKRLEANEIKATIGDYLKLVQLQKEISDMTPREIRVTWVEPTAAC